MVFMALLSTIFLVCSLRTNAIFVIIFLMLSSTFSLLAGAFWTESEGKASLYNSLVKGAGGVSFVGTLAGWYLLVVIMLATLEFPLDLPIGDLTGLIRGANDKPTNKEEV